MTVAINWERTARAVTQQYRWHPDYDDLVAIAELAAWQKPERAYIAALNAVRKYLGSPQNYHRTHTPYGSELPPLLPLHELNGIESAAQTTRHAYDPEKEAIGRIWVEWCVTHPALTPAQRCVLALYVYTGEEMIDLSRRLSRSKGYTPWMIRKAVIRLRRVIAGQWSGKSYYLRFDEKRRILVLHHQGQSSSEIARAVRRNQKTVLRFLKQYRSREE